MSVLAARRNNGSPIEVPAASEHGDAASLPDNLGLEDLKELMRSVNETTASLQTTHAALHQQVARLQDELAEANAQLRRSRSLAALGEMAAGIAHEIRNPLGSIQLYIQMLAEDLAGEPQQAELCEKIDRAVVGLDAIVRDVLLFARQMKFRPGRVSGQELLQRALAACESLITNGEVQVRTELPSDGDDCLHADEGLMAQALGNVIRNAVEAMTEMDKGPRMLEVGVSRRRVRCPDGPRAQRVVFTVQDSGPGVPPDVIDRMFNPFFTTRATGTGLGLAIVHRIVDAHGGHVGVKSGRDGGTTVDLCLPSRPPAGRERKNCLFPEDAQEALELARGVRDQVVKEDET